MLTIQKVPEHVLEDVITEVIDSTQYKGWQLSLRLVNRQFNEAVLHVFYLRKRLAATIGDHTLDCVQPCDRIFCRSYEDFRLKQTYAGRFNIQNFLAIRNLPDKEMPAYQLLQQWTAAIAILREADNLKQLSRDQIRFYSTCSDNPIFNDVPSAVLCEAVASYLAPGFLVMLAQGSVNFSWKDKTTLRCPTFWVALSACALGDLQLFDTYFSKMTLSFESSTPLCPPELQGLLVVAIKQGKPHIVRRLLERYPNAISETQLDNTQPDNTQPDNTQPDNKILRAAIFCNDNEVLKVVLGYTPKSSDLLYETLSRSRWTFIPPVNGSETIRILTRHFAPISAKSRSWLILQSCAVGDVRLLEEFSKTEPLFGYRIDNLGERYPTYYQFAIRRGSVETLRFLIDHGVFEQRTRITPLMAIERALSFNQIECGRELFKLFEEPRVVSWAHWYGWADNAEDILAHFIYENENKEYMFKPFDLQSGGFRGPTLAQESLRNAIQRLRPGNVQYLLGIGIRLSSWGRPDDDSLEIRWPYYNLNQYGFMRTQAVLDSFDLPKLRIIV